MAQGTKPSSAVPPAGSLNGTSQAALPMGVNRKKQKRREKLALKQAAEARRQTTAPVQNGNITSSHGRQSAPAPEPEDSSYVPDDDEGDFYSEDEDGHDNRQAYGTNGHPSEGYPRGGAAGSGRKKPRKKKRRGSASAQQAHYIPSQPHTTSSTGTSKNLWNTTTNEERNNIREFWLGLNENERKSLVKIEKEAVLKKMKEQQKHSCSCTVCGRKRHAIEEELEVLYDAYYDELEQYANQRQDIGPMLSSVLPPSHPPQPHERRLMRTHPPPGQYDEGDDISQGDEDEGEDDEYSSEISYEDDSSVEPTSLPPHPDADFLQFGSSLQVKGGILTVADDLLKNDGKKFIEMMEQLAERRMQREEEATYQSHHPPDMHRRHHDQGSPPEADYYDDEEDEEADYEDDDYEDDEEDEDDTMTEEQRMEEGRRMFQIFAARMFEQRVLQAYREKVAAERQQKLLEEEAQEELRKKEREAKKALAAQKRRERKEQAKKLREETNAQKQAAQAAKEAAAKAEEERRQEELRKKKEEQRRKKEAERKAQEEERQRKEAEKLRRQQEERERQLEAERKQRELKQQEKKAKEEARRKEREEREAREKEAREKKAQEERERRERELKAKAERERQRKEEQAAAAAAKKASQPIAVPLPPTLVKQNAPAGVASPHITPAIPKAPAPAPTPNRPRQTSQQGSHGSSPKTPHIAPGTSQSISPTSQLLHSVAPKSIGTKPATSQQPTPTSHGSAMSPMLPIAPPPGMPVPHAMNMPPGFSSSPFGQSAMAPPGLAGPRSSISHSNLPFFPRAPGSQGYPLYPQPSAHTMSPLPGGRGFPVNSPPGLGDISTFSASGPIPGYPLSVPSHSRQASGTFGKASTETPAAPTPAQPISRPTPIQRPSSVKPHADDHHSDVDELAGHLGSRALLDDADIEPPVEPRRTSLQHGLNTLRPLTFNYGDHPPLPRNDGFNSFSGSPGGAWGAPSFPAAAGHLWGGSPTTSVFNAPHPLLGPPRLGEQRLVWIRRMLCSICRTFAGRQSTTDGFLDINEVTHQLDSVLLNQMGEPPASSEEIKAACDVFGDPSNGGGTLVYREVPGPVPQLSHIKFTEESAPKAALGEIGSPVPGHSVPISGSGLNRPFPGLGRPV
ncbi:uncharacterized protein EI97DRAFT_435523 [Westerdykella ornata]|uniref:Stress response protein NST1 n=1 Tax=Westerdykella ornata TaxID=318751 RepID=A0A6A6JC67_WESOR|nr:uncharacterized protein EI97DRAFT_435523 [Westerdykella ornata]KAF2274161.1 hypothetical protein EI97DRAFT_435523 [Westerdykella ornata]